MKVKTLQEYSTRYIHHNIFKYYLGEKQINTNIEKEWNLNLR
jgi:hypothetical protein